MELWDIYDENRRKTGRVHGRGEPMGENEYHLIVHVWIRNETGAYLIARRAPGKSFPGLWECPGGSVIAGEDSLSAALRETLEETGIELKPERSVLVASMKRRMYASPDHLDIWLFCEDFPINKVVLREGETDAARWATEEEIRGMMATGEFVPVFDYLDAFVFTQSKGE